ncbi:MAG: hypothetical protein A2287_08870 [Candidatus Melainabacteria bacterium RIFOXYA12_FULL_32_12]|nr:MAG: hypothetical protein A2255_11120 [Candidatus Melainabacteria bacterium RIFOXYA2_FULL_32_9]OGI26516.1 MAG: hypothetical protein A2287_08870 [Candidatus Melainabacteria bacterium RIFOXYA12_FULL_32_12]
MIVMKLRKKTFVKIMILLLFYLAGFYILFFSTVFSSKTDIKKFEKDSFGGVVINNTNHNTEIIDNGKTIILPPHKSSKQVGVFDADYFIVNRPTSYRNKVYMHGMIKFNDFSSLKVDSDKNSDKVSVSLNIIGNKK